MKILFFLFILEIYFVSIHSEFTREDCETIKPTLKTDCTDLVEITTSGIVPTQNCCYVKFKASGKYYSMCRYLENVKKDFEDQIKDELELMDKSYSDKSIICASSKYIIIKYSILLFCFLFLF